MYNMLFVGWTTLVLNPLYSLTNSTPMGDAPYMSAKEVDLPVKCLGYFNHTLVISVACMPVVLLSDTVWSSKNSPIFEISISFRSQHSVEIWYFCDLSHVMLLSTSLLTIKTLWLLQPYFGHLSCIPVVYVTCYTLQTSMDASKV